MAISLDVVTRLNDASARTAAQNAQRHFDQASRNVGTNFDRNLSTGMDKAARSAEKYGVAMQRSFNKAADASGRVRVEQEKLDAIISRGDGDRVRLIQQSERLATARRNEESAVKSAASAHVEYERNLRSIGSASDSAATSAMALGSQFRNLGALSSAPLITGLVTALVQLTGIAAQASGAIGTLPGVLGAAGAAFGTLKLATLGFGDALDSINDPEKFTEALAKLSPNAQQAARAIEQLMPSFSQLQQATQQSLFSGVGQQVTQLTNTFLPAIQQMTTGVAGAFNQMFMGVTNQLQSPQGIATVQNILTNIETAFQNLAPAAAPFTQAIADLVSAGSNALPGMASGLTEMAQTFSTFLTRVSNSGELDQWIRQGMNAFQQLGPLVLKFGESFLALAPIGERVLPDIVSLLSATLDVLPPILGFAMEVAPAFTIWAPAIRAAADAATAVGTAFSAIPPIVASLWNSVQPVLERIRAAIDGMLAPLREAASWVGIDIPSIPNVPTVSTDFGSGVPTSATGAGGGANASRQRRGLTPVAPPTAGLDPFGGGAGVGRAGGSALSGAGEFGRGLSGWGPSRWSAGVVGPDGAGGTGGTVSDSERREGIRNSLNPSSFAVDPFASVPGAAPLPGGVAPGMPAAPTGPGAVDPRRVTEAQQRAQSEAWDLQEAKIDLAVLEQDSLATDRELNDARRKVTEEGWQLQNAQADLADAQMGTSRRMQDSARSFSDGMGEIGASLDADFGISKGLPGIAENLTKFVANLAFAPMMGKLAAISAANPSQGGYGMLGIMGAQGAFGPNFTGIDYSGGAGYSPSAMGPAGLQPGGYSDAALLANVPGGRYSQSGNADLTQGLADCSSAVEDLVNIMDGRPTSGRSMSTGNADQWLQERGFMPGSGGPGDMRVAFNSGHMQATLPGGTPFNWGSDAAAARGGVGGSGADDPALTSRYYRPAGAVGGPSWSPSGGVGGDAGLFSPANTNPALTPPLATPGTGGPGLAGAPTAAPFAPGPRPNFGPQGAVGGANASTGLGSQQMAATPGGGGISLGGGAMDAMMGAAGALDMLAPGAGQAAQVGMKLINRGIQYGGQLAGIGVSGLMQTFLPSGDSQASNLGNSWFGKIASGVAGARPALPNQAGQAAPPQGKDPNSKQHGDTGGRPPGPTNGVYIENFNGTQSDYETASEIGRHSQYTSGRR